MHSLGLLNFPMKQMYTLRISLFSGREGGGADGPMYRTGEKTARVKSQWGLLACFEQQKARWQSAMDSLRMF